MDPTVTPAPHDHGDSPGPYAVLPAPVRLAETSTTYDTSAADSLGSLGAGSSWPPGVALGPEGAGDGD